MRIIGLVIILLALAACAPKPEGHWVRRGGGEDRYSQDSAACRSEAKRRAERDYLLDTHNLNRQNDSLMGSPSIETDLARRDAERYRRQLYEDCLRNMGYVRVQPGSSRSYPLEAK